MTAHAGTIEDVGPASLSFHYFLEHSPIAIALLDADGTITETNQVFLQLAAAERQGARGWKFVEAVAEAGRQDVAGKLKEILAGQPGRSAAPVETQLLSGASVSLYFTRIAESTATPTAVVVHIIDLTEQKNLEMRFAHSQKMQAVGQLAGGIAHDFNNLLTAMIGFCDLLLMRHPAGDQSFPDIMQIKQNANRAANLVRQLLAFSRRQTLQPKVIDLTDVLAELSDLIRRLIGENIELKMNHGRDLGLVKADQGQLEQVIINLAVNARDAMKEGGTLTIRTSNVSVDAAHPIDGGLVPPTEEDSAVPGDYVLIEVADTGHGIPPDILSKIFEPFFSTKAIGSGTGLGLATVYGIIKQTGGYIYVQSTPGQGTRFCLYFKRCSREEATATAETTEKAASADLTGKGTILLVEDETPVRLFSSRALRNKGYTVLEADCGEAALEVLEEHGKEIDLVVSDVVMPGINGPAMVQQIRAKYPNIRVIFISGYAEDAFISTYGADRAFNFLPKPFTLKQLAGKVKEVIEAK